MKRYNRTPDGMSVDSFGAWVRYKDAQAEMETLKTKILDLTKELAAQKSPEESDESAFARAVFARMGWNPFKEDKE